MITSFDDYCLHQTHEPIAIPVSSDRNFYDRYWFSGFDRSGKTFFEIGFGVYPNRFVMDGHFSVVIDGVQHSFHASRRCPADRTQTVIGPLRITVEEPMRRVRFSLADNDSDIRCDLLFTASTAATEEPKNLLYQDSRRLVMQNSRFTQFGCWEGWIEAGGNRVEWQADQTLGCRDKSWGVRPVGEPEEGAPPATQAEPRVYWVWSPVNFGDVCTQFGSFENADGTPTQLSACMAPTYPNPELVPEFEAGHIEMATAKHQLNWVPGTRRIESGQFEFHQPDGTIQQLKVRALNHFYMRGIGYQHPQWGHGRWQGEEKTGAESWRMDEVDPLELSFIHVHCLVEATMGERRGMGVVETVVLGAHEPSGFREFLDGAGTA